MRMWGKHIMIGCQGGHVAPVNIIVIMACFGEENSEVSPLLVSVVVTQTEAGTDPVHCQLPSDWVVALPRGVLPSAGWAVVCDGLLKISTVQPLQVGLVVPDTPVVLTKVTTGGFRRELRIPKNVLS